MWSQLKWRNKLTCQLRDIWECFKFQLGGNFKFSIFGDKMCDAYASSCRETRVCIVYLIAKCVEHRNGACCFVQLPLVPLVPFHSDESRGFCEIPCFWCWHWQSVQTMLRERRGTSFIGTLMKCARVQLTAAHSEPEIFSRFLSDRFKIAVSRYSFESITIVDSGFLLLWRCMSIVDETMMKCIYN